MAVDFEQFKWLNESTVRHEDGKIILYAAECSDFFSPGKDAQGNGTPEGHSDAPFYYTNVTGDFMLTVRVSHDFLYTYDACAVMVMADAENWAKNCFEFTDFGTHAAVSVVTRDGASDDANGCDLEGNTVWLKVVRVGNIFGFHYSKDGKTYHMTRFFTLHADPTIKVGLVAQSPVGKGGDRVFEDLRIEPVTVKNVREGI